VNIEGPGLDIIGDFLGLDLGILWDIGPKADREGVDGWLGGDARAIRCEGEGVQIDVEQWVCRTVGVGISNDETGVDNVPWAVEMGDVSIEEAGAEEAWWGMIRDGAGAEDVGWGREDEAAEVGGALFAVVTTGRAGEDNGGAALGKVRGRMQDSVSPIPIIVLAPSRRTGGAEELGNWALSWTQVGRKECWDPGSRVSGNLMGA
jgi:hypothetical protein